MPPWRCRFRDTAFHEDASEIRTGHSPENMTTLCSFAINQLRTAVHTNIAAGLRTTAFRLSRNRPQSTARPKYQGTL
ncbi:hypothetical protein ACWD7F_37610 [Streptomyces sp. NPDC005122]